MSKPMDLAELKANAGAMSARLKIMSHPERLIMLCRLDEGEASVTELVTLSGLSQSAVSQHLALLREEGMVETRREAQSIYYSLVPGPAFQVIQTLHGIYCGPPRAPLQRNGGTP